MEVQYIVINANIAVYYIKAVSVVDALKQQANAGVIGDLYIKVGG